MEYCCHVWAGAPSCYLELLDKLQKCIYRTVGPSLTASLEPSAHRRNVAIFSLFHRYYFGECSTELAKLVLLPDSRGRSTWYSIDCMIFQSPFPDVTRMSMSTVSFLAQLDSGILFLCNSTSIFWLFSPYILCFPLIFDLSGFKSRI